MLKPPIIRDLWKRLSLEVRMACTFCSPEELERLGESAWDWMNPTIQPQHGDIVFFCEHHRKMRFMQMGGWQRYNGKSDVKGHEINIDWLVLCEDCIKSTNAPNFKLRGDRISWKWASRPVSPQES